MWWELHSFPHLLLLELSQLKQLALQVSSIQNILYGVLTSYSMSLFLGNFDFARLPQITVVINNADAATEIRVFAASDEVALEYDDRFLLRFNPAQAALIPGLESSYESIRDTAIVNIIDSDCKCVHSSCLYCFTICL